MNSIINFFKEVRAEFKNISWPKKDTLLELSIVVISISVIISLILGGFDFIFTQGIGLLGRSTQDSQSLTPTIEISPAPTIKSVKK